MLLLRRFKKYNNGNISLGVREAAAWCHCGQATACRAFMELQAAGFITCTHKGHLVPEIGHRHRQPLAYRLHKEGN